MGFFKKIIKFGSNLVGDVVDAVTGENAVKAYGKQIKPVIDYYEQFLPYYKEAIQEWHSLYQKPTTIGLGSISEQTAENVLDIVKPWSPAGLLSDLLRRTATQQSIATKSLELRSRQKALGAWTDLASQAATNWARARGARAEANYGMAAAITGGIWELAGQALGLLTGGKGGKV